MAGSVADPLVSTDWLSAHLGEPDLKVVDATFYLPHLRRDARAEFEQAHIPGAVFFDIDAVADHSIPLPHMLPDAAAFAAAVGALGIAADDRVVASMQPYHAIDDGRWAEKKIGHERSRWTYAFRSLLDSGAVVTFGSDWTVAPLNPILGIYAAVTRRTLDGKNPNGWIPEQKITVEEALRCYTANNAWAMFRENEIGKIAPGMLADVVVLSDDLFKIASEKIDGVKVDYTIFDGKIIYERH